MVDERIERRVSRWYDRCGIGYGTKIGVLKLEFWINCPRLCYGIEKRGDLELENGAGEM